MTDHPIAFGFFQPPENSGWVRNIINLLNKPLTLSTLKVNNAANHG
jgi:hypothetical protein